MTNINDVVERVNGFIDDHDKYVGSEYLDIGYADGIDLRISDLRTILAELDTKEQANHALLTKIADQAVEIERLKNSVSVIEYASNHIPNDKRRGIFIRAYVEGEDWAVRDFEEWKRK